MLKARNFLLVLALLAVFVAPALAQDLPAVDPLDVTGDIVTAGSSTVFPLSEKMVEVFVEAGYSGENHRRQHRFGRWF
jgi:ABC-type phosphate transport system substrate-binding protein